MSTTYKVWVQVEKISGPGPEGDEQYDNVGLPDCIAVRDTFKQACAFVRSLPGWDGRVAETSDYRKKKGGQ